MDVTCDHCNTRYEFDEALVSTRGTTVKCTQCGHQFRVRRPIGSQGLDSWTVRTVDGRELVFRAMRELQSAISGGEVTREDVLMPGDGGEPRRLGRIEELETFFAHQDGPEMETMRKRLVTNRLTPLTGSSYPPFGPVTSTDTIDAEGDVIPARTGDTLPPPSSLAPDTPIPRAARPPRLSSIPPPFPKDADDETLAIESLTRALDDALDEPGRSDVDEDIGDAAVSVRDDDTLGDARSSRFDRDLLGEMPPGFTLPESDPEVSSMPSLTPSPSVPRPSILRNSDPYTDPRFSGYSQRRRPGIARWIVGVIALGLIGIGTMVVVKRYVPSKATSAQTGSENERVSNFLAEGDKRLAAGDLEGAEAEFHKASGAADNDPRAARALAQVALIRADFDWVHLRVLASDDAARTAVQKRLDQRLQRAVVAVQSSDKDGEDPMSVLLQIDLLRMQGKSNDARKLVGQLKGVSGGGRALAALDLSEDDPSLNSVIERLRGAAREEGELGRARAMLIYSLGRAGYKKGALKELEALKEQGGDPGLIAALAAFVGRQTEAEEPEEPAAVIGAADDDDDAGDVGGPIGGDFRSMLQKADQAKARGDLDEAERLYHSALGKDPGNSEALAGLADVARDRGDKAGAVSAYESMLGDNPGYLPAVLGLADLKWSQGKKREAMVLYQKVVTDAPGTSYAERAQRRINQGVGDSDDPPPSGTPPSDTPPSDTPPSDTPPSDTPPSDTPPTNTPPSDAPPSDTPPTNTPPIDTSDLPGHDTPPPPPLPPPPPPPPPDAPHIDTSDLGDDF